MAVYTLLNNSQLNEIAARFGLGPVTDFELLEGGSENSNYLVSTSAGLTDPGARYVITICEQKSREEAERLVLLLEHLRQHAFSSSEVVLTSSGAPVSFWEGKPLMVKKYLEGKILEFLPAHLLTYIGRELGKLHLIPPPDYLPKQLSFGIEHFEEVADYAPDSEFYRWLQQQAASLAPMLARGLPMTLIHSDVFFSNVIVNEAETEAIIMDFEEARHYYRLFDLGMMIIGLCRRGNDLDIEMIAPLLKGYREVIDLTPIEEESLQEMTVYAATAMCFWRHRKFHYYSPDPAMFEHYRALQETAMFAKGLKGLEHNR